MAWPSNMIKSDEGLNPTEEAFAELAGNDFQVKVDLGGGKHVWVSTGKDPSSIYIIRAHVEVERYKVGYSINPQSRFKDIKSSSPVEVELINWFPITRAGHGGPRPWLGTPSAYDVERDVHKIIEPYRFRNEWFDCPIDEIISAIRAVWGKRNLTWIENSS